MSLTSTLSYLFSSQLSLLPETLLLCILYAFAYRGNSRDCSTVSAPRSLSSKQQQCNKHLLHEQVTVRQNATTYMNPEGSGSSLNGVHLQTNPDLAAWHSEDLVTQGSVVWQIKIFI